MMTMDHKQERIVGHKGHIECVIFQILSCTFTPGLH